MAYAVVYSLVQTIDHILGHDEYPISVNAKEEIRKLRDNVITLRTFPEMFSYEGSSLEIRIRVAANEAEDVIEHWMHEHIRSSAAGLATDMEYDFGELKMAMEEINSITQEVEELIQQIRVKMRSSPTATAAVDGMLQSSPTATAAVDGMLQSSPTATAAVDGMLQSSPTPTPAVDGMLQSSPTPTPAVDVGLEEHIDKLRVLLFRYKRNEYHIPKHIIPITGMGGIGKTTLARAVFEDEQVVNHFPVRAWITVSQNYQTKNVFEELLFSLEKQVQQGLVNDCDTTERKLRRILRKNKYLIVLDDLWSFEAWCDISKVFANKEKFDGSRIMITTRDEDVIIHDDASFFIKPHKMVLMDEPLSWYLLKQKVFPSKECPSELEKIGKDIAKGCKGLPLAIVVAARILSQRIQTQSSWEEVAQNIRSLIVEDAQFQSILYLSYAELSHPLRSCFLYICGFHDEYEIRVSMLVKLWMAEGFVYNQEDAEEYVTDIVSKNLATITAMKSNGKIKSCIVHDLVRDLYKIKAIDENYERRFSNSHHDLREVARAYASTMHSVISFHPYESSLHGLHKFKLLRVLDVVDTNAYSLPASVFELFHLRFLAFGCPMEVPSSISQLQNLQSLIIRPSKRSKKYKHSRDEVYLPLEIWMMPLLMHLVSFFDLLPNPEGVASALEELLTLSVVKKLICTKEMMKLICNVEKLAITYFGERYQQDYQLQNLVLLSQLEKLTLVVKKGSLLQLKAKPVFPRRLKKLTLSGWRFPWEDMKAIADLFFLQVLKLRDHAFEGHTWNTIAGSDEECDKEYGGERDNEYDEECDREYVDERDKEYGEESDKECGGESDEVYGEESDKECGNESDKEYSGEQDNEYGEESDEKCAYESDEEYGDESGEEYGDESNEEYGVLSDVEYDDESNQENGHESDEECGFEIDRDHEFVKLEYLLIEESDLEKWATEKHHFPALKRLVLKGCAKLNEIPNAIGYKKRLEIIEVDQANLSLLKCVQDIQKERGLQVREL
ncbi:disease resistance RPP8-like protein 3 [Salvia hispanica]|uniref:disease resistance RPP8-like protein 3 n=1 Tax=Salvia hispanica TaxID=49212 RepID=UPI0020095B93|nr:disease resistance RPP8-like protein 3 [Salvia hispanica]XP_047974959.1 disease resistance RPP8-like protein 3 [Salvia hispanica]XP_047974960.1 disease resistance RPP8-like protein 3 [Salvia hispanica]